jgi:hypothetical protein
MEHPTQVLLVKFKSALSLEEINAIVESRADEFRALGRLQQKYYLAEPGTDEVGGLYLWESPEALDDYRRSELRATIAEAYKTIGEPRVEVFNVFKVLREERP